MYEPVLLAEEVIKFQVLPALVEYSILTVELKTELSQVINWLFKLLNTSPPFGLIKKLLGFAIVNEALLSSNTVEPDELLALTFI